MKEKFAEAGAKRADRTIEGNKAIAGFMELEIDCNIFCGNVFKYTNYKIDGEYFREDYLEYHSSWNWLVPVVQKIFSLPIGEASPLDLADVNLAWNRKDITEIWEACVRFVIKYNQNDK